MKTIAVFVQNRDFFGAKLVHAPLFFELQKQYPGARITALCPYASHKDFVTWGFAQKSFFYSRGFLSALKILQEGQFDLIVSLRPEPIWLTLAIAMAPAKQKIGFKGYFSKFTFSKTKIYDPTIYRAQALLHLISEKEDLSSYFLQFPAKTLSQKKNVFVLSGGGAGNFKRWGIQNFLEVARRFGKDAATFYFVIGKQEQEYLQEIQNFVREGYRCEILKNLSVSELASYFQSGDVFITNDCGPAHIAQMLKKPLVLILSNEKEQGERVAKEWFLPHKDASILLSKKGESISTITSAQVWGILSRLCSALPHKD